MAISEIPPRTNYFWFKELAVLILIVQYLIEQYVNYRQIKRLTTKTEMPAELKKVDIKVEDFQKARLYSKDKLTFEIITSFIKIVLECALLWYLYFPYLWNYSGKLLDEIDFDSKSEFQRGIIFILIESLREKVIGIPISYYSAFVIEERHGFNKQTRSLFVQDQIKSFLIKIVLIFPILGGFLWALEAGGEYFYIYVEIFIIFVTLIMMIIFPHFIAPLFNKFTPIDEGPLKDKITELAQSINFPLKKLFIVDGSKRSSHSNAYFYGLGSNKRIVLYDTLVKHMNEEEILAVLAHELGHWQKGHVWKQMLNSFLQIFVLFYVYGFFVTNTDIFLSFGYHDMSKFIGVFTFLMIYSPIQYVLQIFSLKLSRVYEFQADEFATKMNYGELLQSGLVKLFKENSGEMDPDPVYASFNYTHPTFVERLKFIQGVIREIGEKKYD